MNARWNTARIPLVALLAALWVGSAPAQAQVVKPFKISGEGVGPSGLPLPGQASWPHWIIGEATHLGRHYGEGTVQTDSAVPGSTPGTIVGFTEQGALIVRAAWIAEFVVVPGESKGSPG